MSNSTELKRQKMDSNSGVFVHEDSIVVLREPSSPTSNRVASNTDIRELLEDHKYGQYDLYLFFEEPLGEILSNIGAEAICTGEVPFDIGKNALIKIINEGQTTSTVTDYGTLFAPNIAALLSFTKPSPFGKGDQTVFDDKVRKGLELTADQFSIDNEDHMLESIKSKVHEKLFPGMAEISFKRYKMAIYQEGGHFEFHRDTMHATNHQATLLIEVRSVHEGGCFAIDHDGKLFQYSFASNTAEDVAASTTTAITDSDANNKAEKGLSWLAFYTDIKHKVEPVTSGTRIVIQYDIYVQPIDEVHFENDYQTFLTNKEIERRNKQRYFYEHETWEDPPQLCTYQLCDIFKVPSSSPLALQYILFQLEKPWPSQRKNLAIPLFHLYTSPSIKGQYLKNADRRLLIAILSTGEYIVGLAPIIVESMSEFVSDSKDDENCDFAPGVATYRGHYFTNITTAYVGYEQTSINGTSTCNHSSFLYKSIDRKHPLNHLSDTDMIVTSREAGELFYLQEGGDRYTGNDACPTLCSYFQGVMIIRRKVDDHM